MKTAWRGLPLADQQRRLGSSPIIMVAGGGELAIMAGIALLFSRSGGAGGIASCQASPCLWPCCRMVGISRPARRARKCRPATSAAAATAARLSFLAAIRRHLILRGTFSPAGVSSSPHLLVYMSRGATHGARLREKQSAAMAREICHNQNNQYANGARMSCILYCLCAGTENQLWRYWQPWRSGKWYAGYAALMICPVMVIF